MKLPLFATGFLSLSLGFAYGFTFPARKIAAKRLLPTQLSSISEKVTDWVVENLESGNSTVTSRSKVKAGENDTLPASGLVLGQFRVMAADAEPAPDDTSVPIRLLLGRNGWGTGVHPTTKLCLEWIEDTIQGGETLLDYGCGSGILSIAALHLGGKSAIGVDVEAEALITATRNLELNDFADRFEALHTREIVPYGIEPPVDVCVANILIGQLVRPSMVAAITSNLNAGGLLCLSGIRPDEVEPLKEAYNEYIDWESGAVTLAALDTEGSIESYGFDCGSWSRVVGRKKVSSREDDIASMSERAVS